MSQRPLKVNLARAMRHDPTAAEAAAWALLRNRRCLGLKFRRQHVVRGFIADFYCPELRLVVEIDGGIHDSSRAQAEYDEARSFALTQIGIDILRIRNEDVSAARLVTLLEPYLVRSPSPRSGEGVRG